MATINLGAIKFNWKGAYNSSTTYAVDDVVSSGGNSYVCIQAHSNQAVGNATAYWNIMSSAGTNGTNGTDLTSTLSARGDLVFKGASALTRLPKGTAGYFLKQGANDPEWGQVTANSHFFIAKHDTQQSISQGTTTEIVYDTQIVDTDNVYDPSNGRYTPGAVGYYQIGATLRLSNGSHSDNNTEFYIRINNSSTELYNNYAYASAYYRAVHVNGLVQITNANDYISVCINQRSNNVPTYVGNQSRFYGFKVG